MKRKVSHVIFFSFFLCLFVEERFVGSCKVGVSHVRVFSMHG